jgi:hypothetical protein
LVNEIKFLRFLVSKNEVRSNPEKALPINNWPTQSNIKELQQFLGICTFYHKFIANLAYIAAPLYKLLRKETTWKWSPVQEKAFRLLQQKLITLPELAYPSWNLPSELHCDSSAF